MRCVTAALPPTQSRRVVICIEWEASGRHGAGLNQGMSSEGVESNRRYSDGMKVAHLGRPFH
jgi:hypothetical protein